MPIVNELQRCQLQLGTFVEVTVTGQVTEKSLLELSQRVFNRIAEIEKMMTFHQVESELSRLNRCAVEREMTVSDELIELLSFALELSASTQGVFDVCVAPKLVQKGLLPDGGLIAEENANWRDIVIEGNQVHFKRPLYIELGGIAKGYAVDKAVEALADIDCEVTVNAGGDIRMSQWQQQLCDIRLPALTNTSVAVEMKNKAVATSGHYFLDQKKAITHPVHIDKQTRDTSISVFAEQCMVADALTKTIFLMDDFSSVLNRFNAQCIEVDRHGHMTQL